MKYVANIRKQTGVCEYVSILEEIKEDNEHFSLVQREVPDQTYINRKYDLNNEKWLDEYVDPPENSLQQEVTVESLQAAVKALSDRLEAKIDYDVQVNLERDFQLAMIEINMTKGGE